MLALWRFPNFPQIGAFLRFCAYGATTVNTTWAAGSADGEQKTEDGQAVRIARFKHLPLVNNDWLDAEVSQFIVAFFEQGLELIRIHRFFGMSRFRI